MVLEEISCGDFFFFKSRLSLAQNQVNGDEDCNLWKMKVKLNKEAERHPAVGILPCAESQSALVEPTHQVTM